MPEVPGDRQQRRFWNLWNTQYREVTLDEKSERQAELILGWLGDLRESIGRPLDILDVGCGTGWMCDWMRPFGTVTGTDIADEVLERAQARHPEIRYLAGDFEKLDLGRNAFDVLVSLEVLSHVPDQPAFVRHCWDLLRPGGSLLIANQNRYVLERNSGIHPRGEGQIRQWTTRRELRGLLEPHFAVIELTTLDPRGHLGILRILNSGKVNRLVAPFVGGEERLRRLKEMAGLGWTVVARADAKASIEVGNSA